MSGSVLDALEHQATEGKAEATQVQHLLNEASSASWDQAEVVGEGREFRTEFNRNHDSTLFFEDSPVHASVLAAR